MSSLLIGTSGYDYPEWKGVFYPQELKRKDFLRYYATQFNALELNNTFYNMPTPERLYSFYERSEGRLKFSVKANRLLTHEVDSTWQSAAEDFKTALMPLHQKDCLSAVLFQLPERFHYTDDNRIYLADLIQKFDGFPVLVEFRHREWIKESVFAGLEQRHAGIVFCDMPQLKNLPDGTLTNTPFIGSTAYIRLHGRNAAAWYASAPKAQTTITSNYANGATATYSGESHNASARYCYDYLDSELSAFVPVIKAALKEGKKAQIYFNNHPNGSGAKNALKLKKMLEV
ncbi:DUF72 domain-containing protein [Treponema sp.]|uniref:DUF72 domain-containing protein n=1 Tax=Treponema sp. TaxID=166 RepID=UPI00298E2068|nr:DUF72 domain-containing protein [Treponema sp.]MCR5614253.1 DUF72 domain-containing protein [Treponema sp.]